MFAMSLSLHMFGNAAWMSRNSAAVTCPFCNKTGRWPALFLTLTLPCGGHYITLHYSTLPWGGLFITLHYSTLHWGDLFITLHDSTLLCIALRYWGRYSLLYSTYVRFMVAGGDLFVTPPLWHPASVAVRSLS